MAVPRKYKNADISKLYRDSYKEAFDWEQVLPPRIHTYLDVLERSKGCPVTLSMGALLPLTASVCGVKSLVVTKPDAHSTPLNTYCFCVCDPGGGKSATYDYIIMPIVEHLQALHGVAIALENYTTAGIQRHQQENNGYGLITTEEGARFLANVNAKQQKNEGERALLCKMWMGKGDFSTLAEQERGFKRTSMSLAIFIQPEPLINEMVGMGPNDGYLDRHLFFVARPRMYSSKVVQQNAAILQRYTKALLPTVFADMFTIHKNERIYSFAEEAQAYYDELVDDYAVNFNAQYDSSTDSGEDQNASQGQKMITSKDLTHVARMAGCLHILNALLEPMLVHRKNKGAVVIPLKISLVTLQMAHKMYMTVLKQKCIFTEALASSQQSTQLPLNRVKPVSQRIVRAMMQMSGPMIYIRELQKKLYLVPVDVIQEELRQLDRGKLLVKAVVPNATGRRIRRDVFMRPSPESLGPDSQLLKVGEVTLEEYTLRYKVVRANMSATEVDFCVQNHPDPDTLPFSQPDDDLEEVTEQSGGGEAANSPSDIQQLLATDHEEETEEDTSPDPPVGHRTRKCKKLRMDAE